MSSWDGEWFSGSEFVVVVGLVHVGRKMRERHTSTCPYPPSCGLLFIDVIRLVVSGLSEAG
eukprot:5925749-Amphidinium_carterae.1